MPVARGDFQRCTIYPFEIKEILPEQKTIDIKKKIVDANLIHEFLIIKKSKTNLFQPEASVKIKNIRT